jgi:hypothetical protein
MSKIIFNSLTIITFLCLIFLSQVSYAQLSGTYTIPGSPFTTLTSAVDSLNEVGVGSNGVTFNITGGYTENITIPILLTATGTSSNNIAFQKSGGGANPLISRIDGGTVSTSVAGGQGDAVIIIEGSDYVTFNSIDVAASNQGIEYGYYLRKLNSTDGCKFVTIQNCVIDLTKGNSGYVIGIYSSNNDALSLPDSFDGIEITSTGGRCENNIIIGNTIQDVHSGIMLRGYNHSVEPFDFQDQNYIVGQNGSNNILQNYGGGSNTISYGIVLFYQTSPNVSYNIINNAGGGGVNATFDLYGISILVSNAGGNGVFNNNSITLSQGSTRGTRSLYISSDGTSYTINNNTFGYGAFASTQISYMIYCFSSTPNITLSNNQNVTAINKTGTSGNFYLCYISGAPYGGTEIYSDNNFSNITVSGTSRIYGIHSQTTPGQNKLIYNNTLSNWSGNTGEIHCLLSINANSSHIYNNNIFNITGNGHIWGLEFSGDNPEVYRNNIYNLTAGGFSLYGIKNDGTGTVKCYDNQVYNITGNNTSQSLYGLYIGSGANQSVYNNFISDLKAPNANMTSQLIGIFVSGGDSVGVYYNTIYLNASSIGLNFGTAGIFASTTPKLDLRNNIVINTSDANGSGYTVAYQRSNATLVTYSLISDNNNFYVGAPGDTSHLIFKDNINKIQTITDYKVFVSPRDAASFTENSPFVNSIIPPYDLHINHLIATQTESGGIPVTGITTDYDGDLRNVTTPDVGADEFTGTTIDITPPVIFYTPLLNTGLTTNRSLTANITDPSGVPLSGIGLPVLYWRINSGSWLSATAIHNSGSDYEFTFGAGVLIGDTVKYYICAQDDLGNVGSYPSEGAGGFTINPPAASTPPSYPASYLIIDVPLAGNYTVGLSEFNLITGKSITFEKSVRKVMKEIADKELNQFSLIDKLNSTASTCDLIGKTKLVDVEEITWLPIENGKFYSGPLYVKKIENPELNYPEGIDGIYATLTAAVADVNIRGISTSVNFLLTDATYSSETFPIVININNASLPTWENPLTIKPNTGVTSIISGSVDGAELIKIMTDYIIIDGSNSGSDTRDLTIENTSTIFPQVLWIASVGETPRIGVTIKNTNIINGYDSSPLVVSDGDLIGTDGWFNEIIIENNSIQKALHGIYCRAYIEPGNGSGLIINSNDMTTTGANAIQFNGMYLHGIDEAIISDNVIGNFSGPLDENFHGIWLAEGTVNTVVERNKIFNLKYVGAGNFGAHGITVSTETMDANNSIINNVIYDIAGTGSNYISFLRNNPHGICIYTTQSGINVYYNSIHMFGNTLNRSAALTTGIAVGAGSTADIRDNNIVNNLGLAGGIGYGSAGIFLQADATQLVMSDNNNFFVSPTGSGAKLVGKIVSSDYSTLLAWQIATGKDANSLATDPQFIAADDLRPQSTSPIIAAGIPIPGIETDFLGEVRNITNTTIGAYENGVLMLVNAPSNLVAIPDTFTVDLGWQDNSNNELGFIIQRKDGDSLSVNPWVNIDTVNANVINFLDTGLDPNTMYSYRVFGYNSLGNSGFSNIVEVTTFIPVELTTFTAEESDREILVSWTTATEMNNRGFDIERNMNGEWEKIGSKDGKGTTTEATYYSFIDKFRYESFVGTITYRLKQMDFDGTYSYLPEVEVTVDFTPKEYALYQNYPNPFNPITTIKYSLPFESNIRIAVYNILGEMLDVLVDETKQVGFHNYNWNASNLASGIYIYTIEARSVAGDKNYSSVKKMILMK